MRFHLLMPKPFLHLMRLLSVLCVLISGVSWAQSPSPAGGSWLRLEPGASVTVADNPSLDTGFEKGFTLEFWMFLSDVGEEVSSGVYFYHLRAGPAPSYRGEFTQPAEC